MGIITDGQHLKDGLRVVSIFEAAKGLLVLLVGFGLSAYIHKDLHLAAERLVRHFHLNPASRYPLIFLDLADHVTDTQLWALALSSGQSMGRIAGMVAPYPTLGEVSKRAAGAYFSPRLFANPRVKRVVGLVQRYLP